eukprot:gene23324-30232_t
MPVVTCGGMRQQETWQPKPEMTLNDINKECQKNFEKIIDRAMELGINHFETARGYGTSETQYGPILKKFPRESYILQSKVAPKESVEEFKTLLEKTFKELQIEEDEFKTLLEKTFKELQIEEDGYLDLFSFHGINVPSNLEWITKPGGCLEVVKEYQAKGKIKFVGFSTHGMTPLIIEAIETNLFDYVNLHYQFVGSYTASGTGPVGGNLAAIKAAKKHDMGVFIISAADKGGCLYEPPRALYRDCLPLSPIAFNNLFLWSNDDIHTFVLGAARPEDFDETLQALQLYDKRKEIISPITDRLYSRVDALFGPDFKTNWFVGLPDAYSNSEGLPITHIYWLWWIIKAWGLYGFAVKRYANLETNIKSWDENKTFNNWVPGVSYRPERESQLVEVLKDHPKRDHVVEVVKQLHQWISNGGCLSRGEKPIGIDNYEGWELAYDLQPSKPFPERG